MKGTGAAPLYGLLLILTIGAYLPLWENDFVDFDDDIYITSNAQVRTGLTPSSFCWAWTNADSPYRMPITWLSLQLDAQLSSELAGDGRTALKPAIFHGQNLFWHCSSVLLLFGLWRRLTGALWRSFLVAALFAVHPMHVESVAWAIERKDVLMAFFGILTIWAFVRYTEAPSPFRYVFVIAAYLMSLLSKPMLMTLPFVLFLLDIWPLRRLDLGASPSANFRRPIPLSKLVLEKLPLLTIGFSAALICTENRAGTTLTQLPMLDRLMNALAGYEWYVTASLWPARLTALYPHPFGNWSTSAAVSGAVILASITALAFWQVRRRPWLLVGWLWFIGTLFPVIGLAQGGSQAWADRFSYWPHIGLFVAVVWELSDLVERLQIPAALTGTACAIVLGALAATTWIQLGYWRSSEVLWERAVAVTVNNDYAHQHLAVCYRKMGRISEANEHGIEAARIQRERLGHRATIQR
jgi:hypothetical protein